MYRIFRPFRLQPPFVVPKLNRLLLRAYRHDQPSGCRTHLAGFRTTSLGLHLSPAGSPRRLAESSSLSYGLAIHLPMLSTSRCRNAVSFSYRTRFRPDGDSHPAGSIPLQTHWRQTSGLSAFLVTDQRAMPRRGVKDQSAMRRWGVTDRRSVTLSDEASGSPYPGSRRC